MSKIIAMIPARLGSQRVPLKNIRYMNGKPMIAYTIEAAKAAGVFDEIYVNSEADILGEIAVDFGVKFYKRPPHLSTNAAINDDFALDFIQNVKGDILVQVVPTSPLIDPSEIKGFVDAMMAGKYDTMVSVRNHQIECLYEGNPINFGLFEPHKSSQGRTPVQSYTTVLMAWHYNDFLKNIKEHGGAYHGCGGKIGYYLLKGFSTIDVDHEEDFAMAELALKMREMPQENEKRYYQSKAKI
jgi:CMP-N-acetylneuraminic acid synthetase